MPTVAQPLRELPTLTNELEPVFTLMDALLYGP
jgi:hypothetical protein